MIKLTRLLLRILQRVDLQNGGIATALAVVGNEEDIVAHAGHQSAYLKVRSPATKLNRYLNVQIKNEETAKKASASGRAKSRTNGFRRRSSCSCRMFTSPWIHGSKRNHGHAFCSMPRLVGLVVMQKSHGV